MFGRRPGRRNEPAERQLPAVGHGTGAERRRRRHIVLRIPRPAAAAGRRLRLGDRVRQLHVQHGGGRDRVHVRHIPQRVRRVFRRRQGQNGLGGEPSVRHVPQRR